MITNSIHHLVVRTLVALAVTFTWIGLAAQQVQQTPEALIKATTDEVLATIKQSNDRQRLLQVAESNVAPHFDFTRMTRLAVGRSWQQATPTQQQALEKEFRDLLVRTYTNALTSRTHKSVTMTVRPMQGPPSGDEVTVRTQVTEEGNKPVAVNYQLEKKADGWKVFDVIVDDISLVTNYREQFSQEINRSGIDGLIKVLSAKNQGLAAAKPGQG